MEAKLKAADGKAAAGAANDRHTPWAPSQERDQKDPELAAVLRKVQYCHRPPHRLARWTALMSERCLELLRSLADPTAVARWTATRPAARHSG